jgi:hypothetical protein
MKARCRRAIVPNRIKALDYVFTPHRPSIRSPLAKSTLGRECAEVDQQLLFQIEDLIPPDPSANSSRYPAPHPEWATLKELSKILGDEEAIHTHVVAVRADSK